jgi:pimeloyl-ACP methyl ester carboxylesterase
MQRPVMDPTFIHDAPGQAKPVRRKFAWLWRLLRICVRILFFSPFAHKGNFRNEEGTRLGRIFHGITYRLAFVPIILVMFLISLVFAATHPGQSGGTTDPLTFGVYYDPVNFLSEDGARLEGWLVPVIDAKRVLEEKDAVIGKKYPAVVLVHDFAASRQQLLPLVKPLHDAGFVVLAINLRGASASSTQAQTFGIKEAMDVKAGVEMLRRRAFVEPGKIAVIGIGTGANATCIAARNDPGIAAVVLSAPVNGFDQAFANRIGSDHHWLPPLRPLFRWTFQVMNGVDISELDLTNFNEVLQSRHVLMTDGRQGLMSPSSIRGVQQFLHKHLDGAVAMAQ